MSEEVTVNIKVTGADKGTKAVKDLGKAAKKTTKETKDMQTGVMDAWGEVNILGTSLGSVGKAFTATAQSAKLMFSAIKIGVISTGIGAFVVVLGSMAQYFRDNEEGASKFREITSQVGVVLGNVTDIISDFGGAIIKLFSRDLKGFKDGIKDAIDGVKNFGETTKEEMEMARNLEKERAELIIFERDANISKSKSEAEIMKLRMKARDEEAYTNEQRLSFMRQANKLADEQLQKDLHIAKKKLEFQQIENSYSKSSTENLNAEAQLEAQLFNIQRSNFSERKRMKSEEQAIVKRINAESDKATKDEETRIQKETELKQKELESLRIAGMTQQEIEIEQATTKYNALLELANKYGQDTANITKLHEEKVLEINKKYNKEAVKDEEVTQETKNKMIMSSMSALTGALEKDSAAAKGIAVAQALMNTYQGITAALAMKPSGPWNFVQAAAIGVQGFAAVKNIMKTDASGMRSSGGDSGGGGGGAAPPPSGIGCESLIPSQLTEQLSGTGTQPVQAYVVETDISESQALQQELDLQTTL